jgi:hypothetical protein
LTKDSLWLGSMLWILLIGVSSPLAQERSIPSFRLPGSDSNAAWTDTSTPSFELFPRKSIVSGQLAPDVKARGEKTAYGKILLQSLMFLGMEHGYRLAEEEKSREQLKGSFFHDWFDSAKNLSGWDDGGTFFSNYVCHPVQGSLSAFIFAQNHPQSRRAQFGANKEYLHAKAKQLLFSTIYSVQFEIGPISECSLGNLGQKFGPEPWQQRGRQTYVDQVITPVVGTAWSIGEDFLDRQLVRPLLENHRYLGKILCVFLNPTRSAANVLAFRPPWHRE